MERIGRGDILVTEVTDWGLTALIPLAGALVTETGGPLSLAAVTSREYGIPAVLACAGATEALTDGDEVIVDGTAGTVTRCGSADRLAASTNA
ncbi:PEP-utilizing enzyme [Planctomycetota bacterium]